jgi:hypothetical protein
VADRTPTRIPTTAEPTRELPDGVVTVSATGVNTSGKWISTVRMRVEKSPNIESLDLSGVVVDWTDPSGQYALASNLAEREAVDGYFGVVPVRGTTYSEEGRLDEPGQQYELVFDLGEDATDDDDLPGTDDGEGTTHFGQRIEAGWTVNLRFTTARGQVSNTRFQVPDAVGGRESIELV